MSDIFFELYNLVQDAIVIYRSGDPVYSNAAASALLGSDLLLLSESALLGNISTLPAPAAAFFIAGSGQFEAVLMCFGEYRVYRISPADADSELNDLANALSCGLSGVMSNQRFASDMVRPVLERIEDDHFQDAFSIIEHNNFRIIRDLGNVTALGSGALVRIPDNESYFDLSAMVTELVDSARFFLKDRKINVIPAYPGMAPICASRADIERILLNLISNSVKYSDVSTPITISVRTAEDKCLLTVSDRGCGISEDRLANVFRAYRLPRTTDDPRNGVGLGLAVVRRLAEKYGGIVLIDSRIGVGTNVTVSLPLAKNKFTLLDNSSSYPYGAVDLLTALSDILPSEYYSSRFLD